MSEERKLLPNNIHRDPWNAARKSAHNDGAPAGDDTGRGGNCYQASDHALHSADNCRLPVIDNIQECPNQTTHGRADVGVKHSCTRIRTGSVWITTVEAVPANPEDACTNQRE